MSKNVFKLFILILCLCSGTHIWASTEAAKKFTLVIDAGHGGHDSGAIGTFSKEKNINLNVALAFGALVEQNCSDVRIVYTRKTDVFIPLDNRANIANKAKADLFISIHTNALPAGRIAYGAETYTLGMARASENLEVAKRENAAILVEDNYEERYAGFNPNSAESYIIFEFMQDQYMRQSVSLAKMIQNEYVSTAGRKNKGVHQAGFLVLRKTSMPSVLTELGFISTPEEERFLNSSEGINKMAYSIFQGFINYKASQEGKKAIVVPFSEGNLPEAPKVEIKDNKQDENKTSQDSENAAKKEEQAKPAKKEDTNINNEEIVFKIQIGTSPRRLRSDSQQFKGLKPVDLYMDGNTYKYTYGEERNYEKILKLRQEINEKIPGCFVVAFKDGKRINISAAIKEYKSKNRK